MNRKTTVKGSKTLCIRDSTLKMKGLKRNRGTCRSTLWYKTFLSSRRRKGKPRGRSIHVRYVSLIPRSSKNLTSAVEHTSCNEFCGEECREAMRLARKLNLQKPRELPSEIPFNSLYLSTLLAALSEWVGFVRKVR